MAVVRNNKPASGVRNVWALKTKAGTLVGNPYVIGKRDRLMPDWWPTRHEALAAQGHYADNQLTPVKIQLYWTS